MLKSALKQFHRMRWRRTRACYTTKPEERFPTIDEVRLRLFEQMLGLPSVQSSGKAAELPPLKQEELPERTMKESYVAALVPLGSDAAIRDQYMSFLGTLRVGRLMADMDFFAVWTARAFLRYPPGHIAKVVTVFVDEFEFTPVLPQPDRDIVLRGRVTWTGTSTLESEVRIEQQDGDKWTRLTKCFFVMGARTLQNKSMPVNRLRPTTPEEEKIIAVGYVRKQGRTEHSGDRSLLQPPTSEEYAMLHRNFLETLPDAGTSPACLHELPRREGSVCLKESRLTATVLAHPVDKNMYNTVFGGYIMRLAEELSFSSTYMICKEVPILRYISYIAFRQPIRLGALMTLNSLMTYAEGKFEQLQVCVDVLEPSSGTTITTNVLHLTYETSRRAPLIFPNTYSECLVYLEGRRQFLTAARAMVSLTPATGAPTSKGPQPDSQKPPAQGPPADPERKQ